MHFLRTKLENVKLREDLVRQNKKLEEMFEVLQKQIQNLARNLDKQVSEEIQFENEDNMCEQAGQLDEGLDFVKSEVRILRIRVESGVCHLSCHLVIDSLSFSLVNLILRVF